MNLPPTAAVTLTIEQLQELLDEARTGPMPEHLTTGQAAALLGHSPSWWKKQAPKIPGAWQESDGAPWHLPLEECRDHIRGLQRAHQKRRLRGPRRKVQ